jgi:hypothetical protein
MSDIDSQPSSYPFAIAPVHYPDSKPSTLNVWNVQEFFRIELLLRSQTVQTLYRRGGIGPESTVVLGLLYGMTWDVLQGSHHRYIRASPGGGETIPGFSIMTFTQLASLLDTLNQFLSKQPEELRTQLLTNLYTRFLGLMIDPALPPDTVLRAIRPTLEARHKTSTLARVKKPYPFDVPTWLGYLSCYDLRIAQGVTFGQIAKHVYQRSGEKPRDRAEKAVRRTRRFIQLAESMNWPPSKPPSKQSATT